MNEKCSGCDCTKKKCEKYRGKGAVACCPDCSHTGMSVGLFGI